MVANTNASIRTINPRADQRGFNKGSGISSWNTGWVAIVFIDKAKNADNTMLIQCATPQVWESKSPIFASDGANGAGGKMVKNPIEKLKVLNIEGQGPLTSFVPLVDGPNRKASDPSYQGKNGTATFSLDDRNAPAEIKDLASGKKMVVLLDRPDAALGLVIEAQKTGFRNAYAQIDFRVYAIQNKRLDSRMDWRSYSEGSWYWNDYPQNRPVRPTTDNFDPADVEIIRAIDSEEKFVRLPAKKK